MGRTLDEIISELTPERQRRIEKRYQELKQEVESLRELREIAGKVQADVATALKIKQPSVSKIEQQADMYLSTLRRYVEAVGGELELVVKLPQRPVLRLRQIGDAVGPPIRTPKRNARSRRRLAASS
jgi:transcriptional regulator with XRE-family HTH domain